MITFDQAFEIVMNHARRLEGEAVDIDSALGRVLAEDVLSDMDMPPFNKSAMDGYACRRADLASELEIIDVIPAGKVSQKTVGANQCCRIMTGAKVPTGADCVIMQEFIDKTSGSTIRFVGAETADNICLAGEDFARGQVVLAKGSLIKPADMAVLASVGCVTPNVCRQVRVGIIATGDELVEPSATPAAGQIRNSNSHQLVAQVQQAGGVPCYYGIARDTEGDIDSVVKRAISENDVVLISGGVSVGEFDLVPGILQANGIDLVFEKIAIKPGKPTVFGVSDDVFCFGLPGNPVSTYVLFELLVRAFLSKMMGHEYVCRTVPMRLTKEISRKRNERPSWIPVVMNADGGVEKVSYHGSAHINALSIADGLICIPVGVSRIDAQSTVNVRLL